MVGVIVLETGSPTVMGKPRTPTAGSRGSGGGGGCGGGAWA